ncbi:MAG: hypothetical protein Q9226_007917 [Calogaya cf. arnoldii]
MEQPENKQVATQRGLQLVDLGPDVLNHILDHVSFHQAVLPHLYRTLHMSINSSVDGAAFDYKILQMLDKDNQGLNYVKELVLRDIVQSHTPTVVDDYPEAALLVHLLPRNTLQKFFWVSWNSMPHQIYQTLYSRQHTVRNIELNCSNMSIDTRFGTPSSPPGSFQWLKDLESLRIMPQLNEAMPEIACKLFKQHDTIRRLELDLVHMYPDTNGGEIQEPLTSSGGIKALLGKLEPSSAHLRTIHLTGVNLSTCHKELSLALDLANLSHLTIVKCQYAEKLLEAIAKSASIHSMQLEGLTLYHSRQWNPPDPAISPDEEPETDPLLAAVDRLLVKIPASLKHLWICLRGFNKLPSVEGLIHHGSKLQWLFIDVREQKGSHGMCTYDLIDWQMLCKGLGGIKQLDMGYPEVVAPCQTTAYPEFCDFIVSLSTFSFSRLPKKKPT